MSQLSKNKSISKKYAQNDDIKSETNIHKNLLNKTAPLIPKPNKEIINDIFNNKKYKTKNLDKYKSSVLLPGNLNFDEKIEFKSDPNFKPKLVINKFNNFGWEFTDKQNISKTFQVKLDELRGNKAGNLYPHLTLIPDRWQKRGFKYIRDDNDLNKT